MRVCVCYFHSSFSITAGKKNEITAVDKFSYFDLRCTFHDSLNCMDISVIVPLNLVQLSLFFYRTHAFNACQFSMKNAYHMMLSSSIDQSAFFPLPYCMHMTVVGKKRKNTTNKLRRVTRVIVAIFLLELCEEIKTKEKTNREREKRDWRRC